MAGPSGQDLEVLIGFGVFAIAGLYYWQRNLPSNWTLVRARSRAASTHALPLFPSLTLAVVARTRRTSKQSMARPGTAVAAGCVHADSS